MPKPQTRLQKEFEDSNIKLTAKVKAGGCAAKISAAQLSEVVKGLPDFARPEILTQIGTFEDAAVYKISEDLALVQTVDFFPPVVDDPHLFGKIAAANALSDIYAMGATPTMALSVLCFPVCDYPLSVAHEIVQGGAEVLKAAGAALVGGHSIQGDDLIYGMAATGFIHPQNILTNGGAQRGDALVLTKPIGTGTLLLAYKGEIIDNDTLTALIASLTQLNGAALDVARKFSIHAATDITGFGLVGHVHEMAQASGLKAVINAHSVPQLPRSREFIEQGLVPKGSYANRNSYEKIAYINDQIDLWLSDLLFDPQTSGGLLFALQDEQAHSLCSQLNSAGLTGAIIGHIVDGKAGQVEVLNK